MYLDLITLSEVILNINNNYYTYYCASKFKLSQSKLSYTV